MQGGKRQLIGQAGKIGRPIAGTDAVVDHFQMRRQHISGDFGNLGRGNSAIENFAQRLRRRHGLARRAPWLEGDAQHRGGFVRRGHRAEVGLDAVNVREQARAQYVGIGGKAGLRRARGRQSAARGIADQKPARRGCGVMLADRGRGQVQRQGERMGGLPFVKVQKPRRHGRSAKAGAKISRPNAAVEDVRPFHRQAKADHRLVAGEHGGRDVALSASGNAPPTSLPRERRSNRASSSTPSECRRSRSGGSVRKRRRDYQPIRRRCRPNATGCDKTAGVCLRVFA